MSRATVPTRPAPPDEVGLHAPSLELEALRVRPIAPSPCTEACPAGINVKSYISLIAEGRFTEALEVVRERCPLPGICGRVCHHPCEVACRRCEVDSGVGIRALKRFVADLELEREPPPPLPPGPREAVAIIGSGPAGLTAAYDLARAGYRPVVFEAEAEPGGMLRYGIADYRLPPDVLDREIDYLTRAGIEIRTGCRIGPDLSLEELLDGDFATAIFAVGAQSGRRLGLAGEEGSRGVEDALAFLRRINRGERAPVRGKVLVIGGGSTAVEAARAALRLGAESVEIVYRRHRGEMPADDEEVEAAAAEGITLRLLTAPSRIVLEGGGLRGLECLEVALGEADASGRRRPIPIPGSEFLVEADLVLAAIGQEARFDFLPEELIPRLAERGLLTVDPDTAMTALRGVFAAGDVVTGPSTVIDAVAAGHEVAESVRRFLEGSAHESRNPWLDAPTEYEVPTTTPEARLRVRPALAPIVAGREFEEVERRFTAEEAMAEAERCLRCGPCSECRICAGSCGHRHIRVRSRAAAAGDGALLLRVPIRLAAGLERHGALTGWWRAKRGVEAETIDLLSTCVAVDEEHCRGCSRCVEVCPFEAVGLVDPAAPQTTARVTPTLCRGCNLCVAVCPTDAAQPGSGSLTATAAPWWGTRLSDRLAPLLANRGDDTACIVITCRRRAAAVGSSIAEYGLEAELVTVRCAGELEAGELLEIYRGGADAVLVAGCLSGHCLYSGGSRFAMEQLRRAHSVLGSLGADPSRLIADWSRGASGGPFGLPLLELVARAHARRESAGSERPGD